MGRLGYPRVMRLAAGIFLVLGLLTLRNAWSALAPSPPGAKNPEASGASGAA